MEKISSDLWVPAPIDEVWNFASHAENLAKISPTTFSIKVEGNPATENGVEQIIKVSPYSLPVSFTWVAAISDVTATGPTRQFVDTQKKGPFAVWRHQHIFESGDSTLQGLRSNSNVKAVKPGTWIRDRLEYTMPMGAMGRLAHKIFLRRELESMFAFRRQKLWEKFGLTF